MLCLRLDFPRWKLGEDDLTEHLAESSIGIKPGATCGPYEASSTLNNPGGAYNYFASFAALSSCDGASASHHQWCN